MSKGLQAAIENEHIINITKMSMTLENKRAARNQLVDPGTDGTQATEVISAAEVALIAATVDLGELEAESNPILLCTETNQQFDEDIATTPNDGPIIEKIAERLSLID